MERDDAVDSSPYVLRVAARLRDEALVHLRAALPNEGCGVFATREDDCRREVVAFFPAMNLELSVDRFRFDPVQVFAIERECRARGWIAGVIVHSHPHVPARPSRADLRFAAHTRAWHMIVSLPGETTTVWRFANALASPVALVVVSDAAD